MIGHYLTSALRNFRRNPLSAAIKLLALALGLACVLTAHVIGDYFRHADGQWAKAERTYVIEQEIALPGQDWIGGEQSSAVALAKYLRTDFPGLDTVAQMPFGNLPMKQDGATQRVVGLPVDPEFLDVFDLEILAGEAALDRPHTVLVSDEAALRLFGDEDPVGQILTTDGRIDLTVTGVFRAFPVASHLGMAGQMYLHALPSIDSWIDDYTARLPDQPRWWEGDDFQRLGGLTYVVLPADGSLTASQLQRRLDDFAARRAPPGDVQIRFRAIPMTAMTEIRFNGRIGMPAGISLVTAFYLLGALTLAVGCTNFANLSAAEAAARAREIGLRKTVGALRRQVAAQMLVESAILAGVALILVLPLSGLLATAISSRFSVPIPLPSVSRFDYWAGVAAIAVAVSVAAGIYPALMLANFRPVFAMRGMGGGSGAGRTLLIGAQFATAALLMTLVLVMLAQNAGLRRAALRPGEDPIISLALPPERTLEAQEDLLESLSLQLLSDPAITGVTFRENPPFSTESSTDAEFAQSLNPAAPRFPAKGRRTYYDYFETLGVEIVAGRAFLRDTADTYAAMIDTKTAELMGYTPQQAVGQPIYRVASREQMYARTKLPVDEYTVIGVVEREPLDLAVNGPANYVYIRSVVCCQALVRLSAENVDGGLAHVRRVWTRFDQRAPANTGFLDDYFEQSYRAYSMIIFVFVALSAIAVSIAAMGLFGMASFVVQRRVREIGVRKTLGASSRRVLGLMLWDFSKPVIVANLIAWPFAYIAARAYLDLFVTRIDLTPLPFVGSLAASLLIAWIAVGAHAVRAASVKPALVLKTE